MKFAAFGFLTVLASAVLGSTAGSALAADNNAFLVNHDMNGNGSISERELDFFRMYLFLVADSDGDGSVAAAEWNAVDASDLGVEYVDGDVGLVYWSMASLFVSLDSNVDGGLSELELTSGLVQTFATADADKNRRLSADEFAAAFLLPAEISTRMRQLRDGQTPS